jgi:hypothetical protein
MFFFFKLTSERKKIEIMRSKWKFYIDNELPKKNLEKQFLSLQMKRQSKRISSYSTDVRRADRIHKKSRLEPKSKTQIPKKIIWENWTLCPILPRNHNSKIQLFSFSRTQQNKLKPVIFLYIMDKTHALIWKTIDDFLQWLVVVIALSVAGLIQELY